METTPRHWDVAPFIVVAVTLGLIGQLLAESRTVLAGMLTLAALAFLLTGLVRWTRRSRRTAVARTDAPERVTV